MIYILIVLACAFFCWYFYHNLYNPGIIMALLWVAILLIYYLNFESFTAVSMITYISITLGVVFFTLGCFFSKYINFTIHASNSRTFRTNGYVLRYNIVIFLEILSILVLFPEVVKNIRILMSGETFALIRANNNGENNVLNSSLFALLRNYIISPFIFVIYPIAGYTLYACRNKTIKFWVVALSAFLCVINTFTQGGRATIVYFLLHIILIGILIQKKLTIPKRIKRWIVFFIVVGLFALYQVSLSRGITKFGSSFVVYFSGCVPLLDNKLSVINQSGSFLYGGAFFNGVLSYIFTVFENLGFHYPSSLARVDEILFSVEQSVSIGSSLRMNAFVSMFYYFYLDGGLIGIVIESYIYGCLCSYIFRRSRGAVDGRFIVVYALLFQSILFSMVRFQLVVSAFVIALILPFIMFRRKKPNEALGSNAICRNIRRG